MHLGSGNFQGQRVLANQVPTSMEAVTVTVNLERKQNLRTLKLCLRLSQVMVRLEMKGLIFKARSSRF